MLGNLRLWKRSWPRIFTLSIAHNTIHHYRISILNRSCFQQFQTNLSETLHEGERFVDIFDGQKAFWNWPKKSMISETGVYTIVHYGVSKMTKIPWPILASRKFENDINSNEKQNNDHCINYVSQSTKWIPDFFKIPKNHKTIQWINNMNLDFTFALKAK